MSTTPTWVTNLYRLVGTNIAQARARRGSKRLTQQQLAQLTDGSVSRSSIANIERGLQHISLAQLYRLADALGFEVEALLPTRSQVFGVSSDPLSTKAQHSRHSEEDRAWLKKVFPVRESSNQEGE